MPETCTACSGTGIFGGPGGYYDAPGRGKPCRTCDGSGRVTQPEWLWEVWTQNGYVMGTGSIAAAYRRAYCAIEKGEGVVIKTSSGAYVEVKDRRSQTPGAADPGVEFRLNNPESEPTCRGMTLPELHTVLRSSSTLYERGRDAHPVYGPDALANEAPSI